MEPSRIKNPIFYLTPRSNAIISLQRHLVIAGVWLIDKLHNIVIVVEEDSGPVVSLD